VPATLTAYNVTVLHFGVPKRCVLRSHVAATENECNFVSRQSCRQLHGTLASAVAYIDVESIKLLENSLDLLERFRHCSRYDASGIVLGATTRSPDVSTRMACNEDLAVFIAIPSVVNNRGVPNRVIGKDSYLCYIFTSFFLDGLSRKSSPYNAQKPRTSDFFRNFVRKAQLGTSIK
jgi:hypothetical protein